MPEWREITTKPQAKRIRQPVISILAHVDHGKTTLLDTIRNSKVAPGEAGGITQHIGASEVPMEAIRKLCGDLLDKWKIKVSFPGLLFIDTPGHAAFSMHRRRGGSLADIAILVIDVTEGFRPQTDEALTILKQYKTPFIVCANKVDKVSGWIPTKGACFQETFDRQQSNVSEYLDTKIYELIGQLHERGFQSERYDRITDFTKQIAIVPASGLTGEGVPDLLAVLAGMAQRYLEKKLEVDPNGRGRGTVLEVKEVKGLGTTIDVILYDGMIRKGDWIVTGHPDGAIKVKVKALLKTAPMKEIRTETQFKQFDEIVAAAGLKISAPGLEKVMAGNPIVAVRKESEVASAEEEVQKEIEEVQIETDKEGVVIRADTLGSLEAIIKFLKEHSIPIRIAKIGSVTKTDVMSLESAEPKVRIIFAFNTGVLPEAESQIKESGVKLIASDVIYRFTEEYDAYIKMLEEGKKTAVLAEIRRPAKFRVLPGFVFRQCKPAIVGVEVLGGLLRANLPVMKANGTVVGTLRAIQEQGNNVAEAKIGTRVAASIEGATVGRNLDENETLYTVIDKKDYKLIRENKGLLADHDLAVLAEIRDIMLKKDRLWDIG